MAIIYIIYNADGTLFGKLKYGYKKLGSSSSESPCSACDLTHNGLSLTETAEWTATKKKIPAEVQQLHRDELSSELKNFVAKENIQLPVVLGQDVKGSDLKILIDKRELATCSKDHRKFLSTLDKNASKQRIYLSTSSNSIL